MVATPFTGTITMKRANGVTQRESFTASDVNGELVNFKSTTNNFATVRGDKNEVVEIIDIAISAAGVDTSEMVLWVSGQDTGEAVLGTGVINTVNNRLPGGIPVFAGSTIQFKQLT